VTFVFVLATFTLPSLTDISAPLFELRHAAGKGLGLFATAHIKRGTCIIEEAPLLRIPYSEDVLVRSIDLVTALKGITSDQREAYFDLYHASIVRPNQVDLETLPRNVIDAGAGQLVTEEALIARAIFESNSFQMGEEGEYGVGVFASHSRINHNCTPNSHASYNPTLEKLTVYATRPINENEEILVSYIDLRQTGEQRDAALSHRGFHCQCKCCVGPKAADSDSRRERILEAEHKLIACQQGWGSTAELSVPNTLQEGLEVAKELLELLRLESLTGYRYSGA
jgi:hypothetical protein